MAKAKSPAASPVRKLLQDKLIGGRYSDLAKYSDLFDRTSDGILLVDSATSEVLQANPAAHSIFKRSADEPGSIEGSFLSDLFPQSLKLKTSKLKTDSPREFEIERGGLILSVKRSSLQLADYCEVEEFLIRDITAEKEKQNQLESLSLTDEMTGIANFRSFKSRLALEHERAEKKATSYAVLFFDIDHFKHYNDRNGHPAGDEALRIVARTLRKVCDRSHFLARYGGEEFVILCSGTNPDEARTFAEKCRASIEETAFPFGEHQPLGRVTTSIGICVSNGKGDADEVLRTADAALYQSKKQGRNRITAGTAITAKKAA